jgi:prevent-host-death family protein
MEAHNLSASDVRNNFSETINRVVYGHERVTVKRHKDEVAIISAEDLALLERLEREEEDRLDAAEANRILENLAEGRAERIPWERVKEDLEL